MGDVRRVETFLALATILAVGCVRDEALEQLELAPGRASDSRDAEDELDLSETVDAGADWAEVSGLEAEVCCDLVEVVDLEVACAADCGVKECGDDGCGGKCGHCSQAVGCTQAGKCGVPPDDFGKECVTGAQCLSGLCATARPPMKICTVDCANIAECPENHSCAPDEDPVGFCWPDCVPDCEAKECGDDGCGGTCGTCQGGMDCQAQTGGCVCTPEHHIACSEGTLYWFDSCDFKGLQIDHCSDWNLCTADGCAEGVCTHTVVVDDTPCGGEASCQSGLCQYHCGDGLCAEPFLPIKSETLG